MNPLIVDFLNFQFHLLLAGTFSLYMLLFLFLQERAAGALANLAADDKCSLEVAKAGGVHALVTLARSCKLEGVLEQVNDRSHLYAFPPRTKPVHVNCTLLVYCL